MNEVLTKVNKILPQLPYLPQTFRLVWKAAGNWTIASAVLLLLLGVLPAVQVYLLSGLVNGFPVLMGAGIHSSQFYQSWQAIALLLGIWLLTRILNNLSFWIRMMQAELTQDYISELIHTQAIALDLAFFETPDYYDRLHRATLEARTQPIALLENISELARNGMTMLSMICLLFSLQPLIANDCVRNVCS
ncbi:hypothetical protein PN471_19000 [Aphanizomenon sp. CS-733/32]|uniref:hypothetical protein n=1 Tax=Aphanizomenon sp. CS-733/32 TaxID=3021715 RepID=UPI00232BDB13|nr:hypothetical protein [Aphanizomenon sp. CS-733/32]MDB9310672.1 hypothetical protein [Aphanizomenon sp. CS-733/32]